MVKWLNNKKGGALLYVLVAIFIIMSFGSYLVMLLVNEIQTNKIIEQRTKARYLAEAGVEHAMLMTPGTPEASGTVMDGTKKLYDYSISISDGIVVITGDGYIESSTSPYLRITCELMDDVIVKWQESKP